MSAQIMAIAANTEVEFKRSPFLPKNPTDFRGADGTEIYGIFLPGRDYNNGMYQRFTGDGSKTTWDEDEIGLLADAPVVGAFTAANRLTTVVKVGDSILKRVAHTATPSDGEFKIMAGELATATVTFAGVPDDEGTITIDDGVNTAVEFEFDTDDDGLAGSGTELDTSASATAAAVGLVFATAVNAEVSLNVTATDNEDGTVTLTSTVGGDVSGLTVTESASDTTVVDFDGEDSVQLVLGTAPADGQDVEVFMTAAADVVNTTIPASTLIQAEAPQVLVADAAITAIRLTC